MDQQACLADGLQLPGNNRMPVLPSHTMAAAIVASQPNRRPSSTVISPSAKTRAACLSRGAARARPSVTRTASPSSSRSDGLGAAAGGGADREARATSCRLPAPRELAGEHRGGPRVQVGLACQRAIQGLELLGRLRQQRRGVATRAGGERDLPAQQAARACWSSSSGPAAAMLSRSSAASNAPARRLAWAAARARPARGPGSPVSSTARCKNAAAAAIPPRACARPADRSSSAATPSSGPGAAVARCHARRSGSRSRSVTSANARCAARRSGSDAEEYTADRTSGCRNRTRAPPCSSPSAWAASAAEAAIPSRPAARQTSTGSPAGRPPR